MLVATRPRQGDRHLDMADVSKASSHATAKHLDGLDGLRAIAVIAVLLFHADFYWARGGFLGVDLFFVISGFLITGLLADEIALSGQLSLGRFYWRRAKRLLPAAWLMTASMIGAAAWFATDALPGLRGEAAASLIYLTNWTLLSTHVSYFEAFARPPLLQHLWSLAIEEQFYIVWAPLVLLSLRRFGRRALATLALVLAAASAVWMALLAARLGYPDQGDPSRLYFGSDTHSFPLLLGGTLGLVWQPRRVVRSCQPLTRVAGFLAGLAAVTMLLALFASMGEATPRLYPWGFLLAALTSVALIAIATHPGLSFGRWLDSGLLRWIGNRSYGIYLWHWPILMLTRPGIDFRSLDASTLLILRIASTLGVAALSYRYLESPIRHGALERIWRAMHDKATRRDAWLRGMTMALGVLLAFGASVSVLVRAPAEAMPAQEARHAWNAGVGPAAHAVRTPSAAVTPPTEALRPVEVPAVAAQPGQPPPFTGHELTAVGDSVLLGSSGLLKATLPGVDIDATMGWQAADVIRQLKALRSAGRLRAVTLLHLGTNGYVTEDQLRQMLSMLADRTRVILVNTHVPRPWMESNNALFERVALDFPNVLIVRWSDVSEGQPDYFVSDGVHLTVIGQRVFIGAIMREGHLLPGTRSAPNPATEDTSRTDAVAAGDLSPTLVRAPEEAASDAYWYKMARCETDSNWQKPGRWSGGLGITVADWTTWGGQAFAATPAEATPAQQIAIANRISVQGWTREDGSTVKPIGFTTWRCVAALGHPSTKSDYTYTPQSVIGQSFHMGERGEVVRDLQRILGVPRDGIYSKRLRKKHLAYLKQHGLPDTLAGSDA